MNRIPIFITAATVALTAACAGPGAEGVAATGEPLTYEWNTFRQGSMPVDEQDFYRIAGDDDAVREIGSSRRHGTIYETVGGVLALVGATALITYASSNDPGTRNAAGPLILALPIGGITAIIGSQKRSRSRVLPDWRAQETAARYNAHVGASAGGEP
jgi:hypothetical protein